MCDNSVRIARRSEESRIAHLMTLAFARDPICRFQYPDPREYAIQFPEFTRLYAGKAFEHGCAHSIKDGIAAALWLPPGVHPDEEALTAHLERTVPPARFGPLMTMMDAMGKNHPKEPHWFLPLIAVDPLYHSQGHGSALLRYRLVECDREGHLAYLDSSNPANIPFYQSHGFELLASIPLGPEVTMYPMLRRPKRT